MWKLKNETIRETCLEKLHLFAAVNDGTVMELEAHANDMKVLMKNVYENSDLDDVLEFFNRTVETIGFPVHMNYRAFKDLCQALKFRYFLKNVLKTYKSAKFRCRTQILKRFVFCVVDSRFPVFK